MDSESIPNLFKPYVECPDMTSGDCKMAELFTDSEAGEDDEA